MKTTEISSVRVALAITLSVLFLRDPAKSAPPTLETFPVGNFPLALISDGTNIWVANGGSSTVTKLRASDGTNLGTFPVGTGPENLTFDGANIWTANYGSANVTKLRASDGALLGTFRVDSQPSGIAFDGANIWVTSVGQGTITKLRASDGVILGKFPVGDQPYYALFDGTNIWVSLFGTNSLLKLDPTDGSVLLQVGLAFGGEEMVFDGAKVWVALSVAPGMMTAVRAADGTVLETVETSGSSLTGITFDGRRIWATDYGRNAVWRFASNNGKLLGPAVRGVDTPLGMCFDGTSIWVGNGDDATVTKITP